jgi:hypothetical protein
MPRAPFEVPATLSPNLAQVMAYWAGLKRGAANMPFWDDVNLLALPEISGRLFLLDVLAPPERFRFAVVGAELSDAYGEGVAGRFVDEMALKPPFERLRSQCAATTETAASTFFPSEAEDPAVRAYGRLLLPMWGEGRIGMLLGAVEWP